MSHGVDEPRRAGTIRLREEADLSPGDYIKCVHCGECYVSNEELDAIGERGFLRCEACGLSGFVPHLWETREHHRRRRVSERLPTPLSRNYFPTPRALFEHGRDLGLDDTDRSVILALWLHAYDAASEIYPAQDRIASLAGCSRSTVTRRLGKLERAGLIMRSERKRPRGRFDVTVYHLSPLWDRLAISEAEAKRC
jgi:hypothetical protein